MSEDKLRVQSIEEIRQMLKEQHGSVEGETTETNIKWTCFNCNELINGETHLCHYKDAWRQNRYICVDCGTEGSLNSEITYRSNNHICYPCRIRDIHDNYRARQVNSLERITKALEKLVLPEIVEN